MKKIKLICIILAAILAVGLITNIITPGDDPSGNGGSASDLPQDAPENVGFNLLNWHNDERCDGSEYVIPECSVCGTVWSFEDLSKGECLYEVETVFGTYYEYYCPSCSIDSMLSICKIHCYENGVCHLCGNECCHNCVSRDRESSYGVLCLPKEHPVRIIASESGYPYWDYENFDNDTDGCCDICGVKTFYYD